LFIFKDFPGVEKNSDTIRHLSRAAVRFPAGADKIRLARRPKFGWRRRQTFPAAEFGASS